MSSDTSEPVLLEKPNEEGTPRPSPLSRQSTLTPKKCWICICDATEDDPTNPPTWRTPCACNLTAHEACLLDWVADLENPKKKDRPRDGVIRCPQCKTEIKITRPKSYILEFTKALDRGLALAIYPGLGTAALGTIFAGCWLHGFMSVYVFFGPDHAVRIFNNATNHQRLAYGLVPINLIFSRTNFADSVLTVGTFFLLSTQIDPNRFEIDMTLWPPLPSTVFICLPAIRRAYNWLYFKTFADLNRKWLEAVQPASIQPVEGQEQNLADLANQNDPVDGEMVFELEVRIGEDEDNDNEEDEHVPAADDGAQQGEGPGAANNGNGNGNGNAHVHHQVQEIVEGIGISTTILGALVFPTVAAGMGRLLTYALPKSWMSNANMMNGRPGLLRDQWGRSVVGGAIFIVLKDALLLYSRWKRAQTHKMRSIVDYDKKAQKYLM